MIGILILATIFMAVLCFVSARTEIQRQEWQRQNRATGNIKIGNAESGTQALAHRNV